MLYLGLGKTLSWYKNDVDWFILVLGVVLSCYMVVWIGVEEFLYKGNVGFLREMLSKFSKTHVFVLAITWPSLIQIELFKFLGKLDL